MKIALAVTGLTATLLQAALAADARHTLMAQRPADRINRVEVSLEVGGDLQVVVDDKPKTVGMNVRGQLAYDERLVEGTAGGSGDVRATRYYELASAELKIADKLIEPKLRDDRRLVVAAISAARPMLYSPGGPLTRDELDLIDIPGNSLVLDALLPAVPVAVGESWKHSERTIGLLLGLDEVRRADVSSLFVESTGGIARLQIGGSVEGTVSGAPTKIELKGKYQYNQAAKQVSWFGLLIKEARQVGDVASGMEVVARLQMQIAPTKDAPRLGDAAVKKLPPLSAELTRLEHISPDAAWRINHDRDWFITGTERDYTVLRMMDRGQRLAQCNVSTLPATPPEKLPTLKEFQEDVRKILGENFGQFVEARQSPSPSGYRTFRVVVDGKVSEIPIQWRYYLVADPQGRQAAFAFTVAGELVERFDDADRSLVGALRFGESGLAAKPKPAEKNKK